MTGEDENLSKKAKKKAERFEKLKQKRQESRKFKKNLAKERKKNGAKPPTVDENRISKKATKLEAISRLKAVLENKTDHYKFCIDLQFEHLMIEKELTHLARQLSRVYGFNKSSAKPCHLTLASLNKSSKTFSVCCDKNDGFANYILNQCETFVHELFEKDSIVYLTPDSDQVNTIRFKKYLHKSAIRNLPEVVIEFLYISDSGRN